MRLLPGPVLAAFLIATPALGEGATKPEAEERRTSADNRNVAHVLVGYSYVLYGLVLPGRNGPAAYWVVSDEWMLGFDYTSADYSFAFLKVDLAKFEEKVYHATARWFPANSFNLSLGLGERSYELKIGDSFLEDFVDIKTSLLVMKVKNQILSAAVGNQWTWDWGGSLSVDWLTAYVTVGQGSAEAPLLDAVTGETRKNLQGLVSYLRYGPTFALLRITAGYMF